jgi:putative transcriptional regulator
MEAWMTGRNEPTFGDLLLRGAREAAAHAAGSVDIVAESKVTRRTVSARQVRLRRPQKPTPQRIRKIRQELALSQAVFGELLNVSASTVRAWEQGQRAPDGPSLRLLEVAEHHPLALLELATPGG